MNTTIAVIGATGNQGPSFLGQNTHFKKTKTYNSEDSLVVTHPTTNSPACGLSTAERTGSPVFHTLWSYVSCDKGECAIDRVRTG
ncbi:hypothetical protein ACN42_g8902 [Penicillium freii]|uniref:Uncharacterized protein n=1 Tax=Penicillium freii TaxID=48697 RepID=A0A101MCX1_PENFR|nr:hypothetical protein ACN42_g8902 [Penicillium freii]